MRHHELAIIEDVVTHQVVEKVADFLPEFGGLAFELRNGLGEAVGQLDVLPPSWRTSFMSWLPGTQ